MQDALERQRRAPIGARRELRIPGVDDALDALCDFERALKPRLHVPSQRYARFLALNDEALGVAGVTTRRAADHLKHVLEDLRGRSERIDAVLAGFSPTFFSEDHGWRGIFRALVGTGISYTQHKVVAVVNYRRYLLQCLDALNQVSNDRLQSELCHEANAQAEEDTSLAVVTRSYDSTRRSEEVIVRDLVRLPRGTTLRLSEGRDGPFEVWMGKRRFRVETWSGASLVDEEGQGAALRDGRNIVGRGLYNDVIVDARFTDVSRRHLILDLRDGAPAAITDLSSGGTYVARSMVDAAA